MSWVRNEVSVADVQQMGDESVQLIFSEQGKRTECECIWRLGSRVDDGTVIFGVQPCAAHVAVVNIAYGRVYAMMPLTQEVSQVFQEFFDEEVDRVEGAG